MWIYKHPILYDLFDWIFSLGYSARARKKAFLGFKNKKILAVGVGSGKTLKYLKGNKVTGIEPSKQMLDIAEKRNKIGAKLELGSAYTLPYSRKQFDMSIFIFTLCVLKEPGKALKEALRVSKEVLILEYQKPKKMRKEKWQSLECFGYKIYGSRNPDLAKIIKNFKVIEKKELYNGLYVLYKLRGK